MGSRYQTKYSVNKYIEFFNSLLNRNFQRLDSYTERKYALTLEFNSEVKQYQSQPFTLNYVDSLGKERQYTPDFLVQEPDGLVVYEIKQKYKPTLKDPDFLVIEDILLRKNHARFELLSEKDFSTAYQIQNIERLYTYKRIPQALIAQYDFRKLIGAKQCCFGELKEAAKMKGLAPVIPFGVVAHQYAKFDLTTEALNDNTLLEVA